MKPVALLAASALLAGAAGSAANPFRAPQDPAVTAVPAGGAVTMLVGQGGNLGVLVTADGVLVVDSQFERMAPALLEAIAGLPDAGEIRWLINTHHHGDHVGGNTRLGAGAIRMAHERVRERMDDAPESALPALTWRDGATLHFGGQRVEMEHLGAGHTDGDSIVIFHDSGVVHLGDLFFSGRFPFVDLDAGGSVAGLLAALRQVRAELPADWKIIPGHGPLSGSGELDAAIGMIEATLAIARERADAGMSRAEIVAAGLPERWAPWSWQFIGTERWLETLARECGAE